MFFFWTANKDSDKTEHIQLKQQQEVQSITYETLLKVGGFQLTTPSIAVEGEEVLGPPLMRDATAGPRSAERATNASLMG